MVLTLVILSLIIVGLAWEISLLNREINKYKLDLSLYDSGNHWFHISETTMKKLKKKKFEIIVQTTNNRMFVLAEYLLKVKRGVMPEDEEIEFFQLIKFPRKFVSEEKDS